MHTSSVTVMQQRVTTSLSDTYTSTVRRNGMNLRLSLTLCVCLLLVTNSSFGQEISYGGLLGSSLGTLTNSDDFPDPRSKGGYVAGGYIDLALSDFFSVRPQLILVQKGAKLEAPDLDGTVTLDYLEVPILGVISLPRQGAVVPFFYAGGSVSANVNATVELNGVETDIPGDHIRRNDIGGVFGAGVYVDGYTLEARYTTGINSIMADTNHPKTRAFYVIGGFKLPVR